MWVARRAFGPPLRPLFVASLLSPASVPPLGPDGLPTCDFVNCKYGFGNIMLSAKLRVISQIHVISQKTTLRRTEASAPPLGPDGLPTCDFLNCIYGFANIMLLSKNTCYSAKSMLLSQKQRRYTYDSIVYAPTLTLLTILYILQLIIKAFSALNNLYIQ